MNWLLLAILAIPAVIFVMKQRNEETKVKEHRLYDLENFKERVAAELEESRKRREAKEDRAARKKSKIGFFSSRKKGGGE